MHIERTELQKAERACWVFIACLLAVFPVSYLNGYCRGFKPRDLQSVHFFGWLDTTILFLPQYVFPHGFSAGDLHSSHDVGISTAASIVLSILFWVGVGISFAWLTRRLRFRFTVPTAIATIFVVTVAVHALLYFVFGIGAELDGP